MQVKNLAQFKNFLKEIEGDQSWQVVVKKKFVTTYHKNHPAFQKYENGARVAEEVTTPSFILKTQTNSFARRVKGSETGSVWTQFENASKWNFEGNIATFYDKCGRENDHVSETELIFEFTKV